MDKPGEKAQFLGSYLNVYEIESVTSSYNPELEVVLINGRYQLNAGKVNYSFGPLHDAFRRYFHLDKPQLNDDAHVLILGFGAGSVASILREEYGFQGHITGVEWDDQVIYLARKHFYLGKMPNLSIIMEDAADFMEHNTQTFDLIVVDLYCEDKVPEKFEKLAFIKTLCKGLSENGKLVFNKLQQKEKEAQVSNLFESFRDVCRHAEMYKIYINRDTPNCFITAIREPQK